MTKDGTRWTMSMCAVREIQLIMKQRFQSGNDILLINELHHTRNSLADWVSMPITDIIAKSISLSMAKIMIISLQCNAFPKKNKKISAFLLYMVMQSVFDSG